MDRNNFSETQWMIGIPESAKATLNEICTIIADTIETDAVYCLGYRNNSTIMNTGIFISGNQNEHIHFYLVVFVKVKSKNLLAKLNQEIRKRSGSHITATFLVHTTAALQAVKGTMHNFFYRLFKQGDIVSKNTDVESMLRTIVNPKPSEDDSRTFLYTHNGAALDYLQALEAITGKGDVMPCAVLMHLAVEHICLMLIHSLLGYQPQKFSTAYLFELCDYATVLTKEIFPRNTPFERELFEALSVSSGCMRYSYHEEINYYNIKILVSRCREFQSRAYKLALEKIELLNTK